MWLRTIWLIAICILLVGIIPATASDVVGKWFSQTGEEIITIYKAGPEYAGSISPMQGTNSMGTFFVMLNDFSVAGAHVHFRIQADQQAGATHITSGNTYDLDLSPEGQRLIGTQQTYGSFSPANGTKAVTLFLRN